MNLARFRLDGDVPKDVKRWLQKGLGKAAFEPIDPKSEDERTAGFVELEAADRTEFSAGALFHGMHALFSYRVDKLKVPNNAIRAGLLQWAQAFEQKNGRAPGRRERAEQKDTLKKALRAKQEPVTKLFEVSVDLTSKDVFVWATSRTVVDEVQASLESNLEVKLVPRVPAAFLAPSQIDALTPTKELFGEVS
ncbi:MAG: recombination-associated protein RdgC [Myxococcota bacterium]